MLLKVNLVDSNAQLAINPESIIRVERDEEGNSIITLQTEYLERNSDSNGGIVIYENTGEPNGGTVVYEDNTQEDNSSGSNGGVVWYDNRGQSMITVNKAFRIKEDFDSLVSKINTACTELKMNRS